MICVVRNKHASWAQRRPNSVVLPIHVVRRMQIVVKKDVDVRKLVQQRRECRGPVLQGQSVAAAESVVYLVGYCPTYPALVPRVPRPIGERSLASHFRW